MVRITILGAGSEGAAVATRLARLGHEIELWARNRSSPPSWAAAGENGDRPPRQADVDLMPHGLKRETG